nr:hypothetical protein [Chlorokybus atmophyticus]
MRLKTYSSNDSLILRLSEMPSKREEERKRAKRHQPQSLRLFISRTWAPPHKPKPAGAKKKSHSHISGFSCL